MNKYLINLCIDSISYIFVKKNNDAGYCIVKQSSDAWLYDLYWLSAAQLLRSYVYK